MVYYIFIKSIILSKLQFTICRLIFISCNKDLILPFAVNLNSAMFGENMIKRGELYYADLSPVVGSEQGGIRPILIVQNDTGNKYSPTIIAAAITSQLGKAKLPTHIELNANEFGLMKNSVILLEQIRTLDKRRLKERIGELPKSTMQKVNSALLISLGFNDKDIKTIEV